jgi:putative transposase
MPRRGRSSLREQRVFFVTTTTKDHRHVFDSVEKLTKLKHIIYQVVQKYHAKLYGYVLLSNHCHLLVGLKGGGPELSRFMRDIKSLSWRQIFPSSPGIWMTRFDDVAIYTEEQFRVKLNYIHNNPVKAKLANQPEDYSFSSAAAWLGTAPDVMVTTEVEL